MLIICFKIKVRLGAYVVYIINWMPVPMPQRNNSSVLISSYELIKKTITSLFSLQSTIKIILFKIGPRL